jgi:hypothetical protein
MGEIVIVAPHPDDELIGCYEQLITGENLVIIYSGDTPQNRREKALKLKDHINLTHQLFHMAIPQIFMSKDNKFFAPDPIYENHPKHREWGMIGESMARQGYDVTFYNTKMNAPYIHEVISPEQKRILLEKVYPDQKSLWKYEHKYFLFEGYNKWIF